MKRLLFALAGIALLAFMLPSNVQAQAGFPTRATGKVQDVTSSTPTTTDVFNFGFMSKSITLCLRKSSNVVFIRFGTTLTASGDVLRTALAAGSRMTVPTSTPAVFIGGTVAMPERALPISTSASVDKCMTRPWKTRGLVIYSAGAASVDVIVE